MESKPRRNYYESYIAMIKNSIGTSMFKSFYMSFPDGTMNDVIQDGANACAYYVSSILVIWNKIDAVHATTSSVVTDLEKSEWHKVKEPKAGDVIVWDKSVNHDISDLHIGFSIGAGRAISNSTTRGVPLEHDIYFDSQERAILAIYRTNWIEEAPFTQ